MQAARAIPAILVLMLMVGSGSLIAASADKSAGGQVLPWSHTTAFGEDLATAGRDGTVFWRHETQGAANWGGPDGLTPKWIHDTGAITMSSARIVDVDGDGIKDVVLATMGPIGSPYGGGKVVVLDVNGQFLPGWPVSTTRPFIGAVAVADLDNNGDMELIATTWYQIYVWNHDGTNYPGWPMAAGSGSSVSPAVADLDGDDDLEIIYGANRQLYVRQHDGTILPGWPFTAGKNLQAPGVADIDGDGALEIVAGTYEGPYPGTGPFPLYVWEVDGTLASGFPITDPGQTRGPVSLGDIDLDGKVEIVARCNDRIYVWDAQGNVKPGWPVSAGYIRNSATALGDLDGDGDLEVVIGGLITTPSYKERVYAFHHDGTTVAGWPAILTHPGGVGNINSGPIIADIDGDPDKIEIVVKVTNYVFALHSDGTVVADFPYELSDNNQSATFSPSPAVGDLDGDGTVEYVFVSISGKIAFFDETHTYSPQHAYWPMFQQNPENTCCLALYGKGDLNCDGKVTFDDIDPFVLALSGQAAYQAQYPNCNWYNADINADGKVDFDDIDPFVALLGG